MTLSRPDFDFSKYVEVPDAWIENALNIPNAVQKQPKIVPLRRYVTAAGIVLVIALGISVYFLFGNKKPIPVAPTSKADNTESTAQIPSSPTHSTDAESQTDSTFPQGIKREAETQLSTDAQGRAIIISAPPVTRESTATMPPKADAPAQAPTDADPTPRETSPGNFIVKPAAPTQPNVSPTSSPATEPFPTPAQDEEPQTAVICVPARNIELIDSESDTESGLYCCVYDSRGNPIGAGDLYDASHLVTVPAPSGSGYQVEEKSEYRYSFEYLPSQVSGELRYEFYIKGNRERYIVYSGTMSV